jgi:TolC family type I secretion outer membrane protein
MWTMVVMLSVLVSWAASQAQDEPVGSVRTLTLPDCIAIAMEQNPDAIISKRSVASARAQVLGAVSNFLPQVNASSSYNHSVQSFRDPLSGITVDGIEIPERFLERKSDSYSASLSLSQSLFRGGYNFSNLSYSRAGHRRAKESYEQTKQLVALEVKVRYYDLLRASRLLQVAEELVRSSEEQVKLEESLNEIGATTKANLLRAKVKLGEDRLGLITAQNNLSITRANLNDILGWDLDTPVEPMDDLELQKPPLDLSSLTERAISQHPGVKMADAQRHQARASLGMAKSGRLPSLSASGSYSWYDSDLPEDAGDWKDHDSWSVGLSLSLPIFDGLSTKSNIRQAQLNLAVTEEELKQTKREVTLAVKQAFLNLNEAEKRIQVTEESLELAEEERRLAEERYRLGASFLLELIDSQVAYSTAQTNYISALYDYKLALAQLEQAVGQPVMP